MKKLLSLTLALLMVFSLATVALAEESSTDGVSTLTFHKTYTVTGGTTVPTETLTFNVVADDSNPDTDAAITIGGNNTYMVNSTGDATLTDGVYTVDIPMTLSGFDTVGVYKFTVTETNGDMQGVGYSETVLNVSVLAYYENTTDDNGNTTRTIKTKVGFTAADDGTKVETIANTYSLGSLIVSKTVSGNLASTDAEFEIDVTFTADKPIASEITYRDQVITMQDMQNGSETVTITLKHGESVTFENIPAGVIYSVAEKSQHILANGSTLNPNSDADKEYTVTYTDSSSGTIAEDTESSVSVENYKGTEISTGITLDSVPFILILSVCAAAVVLFVIKRRNTVEF